MDREILRNRVIDALGDRRLVFAGLRGSDIESISDIPQLFASYSIIDAYRRHELESVAYEDLTGIRVDLDRWDIDDHLSADATVSFRRGLLTALSARSALLPYRPSRFLSSVVFARQDRCTNLGLSGAQQSAFEHKPWVETSLRHAGVPTLEWRYIADEEQPEVRSLLDDGPVVLRRSRTSGGEGVMVAHTPEDVREMWPRADESFVAVAKYLENSVSLNVAAVVWSDGVTVHHPSVQLIGIPECTTRPLGYCGNDFGAVKDLEPEQLDTIEDRTRLIGAWLRGNGYIGTFGVDFLLHDGEVLFTEINARFQGSTHASARLSVESGQACLVLEHVAAMLGLSAGARPRLRDIVPETPDLAHIVVHSASRWPMAVDNQTLRNDSRLRETRTMVDMTTRPTTSTQPGGVIARLTTRNRVTDNGYRLRPPWVDMVGGIRDAAVAAAREEPSQ